VTSHARRHCVTSAAVAARRYSLGVDLLPQPNPRSDSTNESAHALVLTRGVRGHRVRILDLPRGRSCAVLDDRRSGTVPPLRRRDGVAAPDTAVPTLPFQDRVLRGHHRRQCCGRGRGRSSR
jgi:hypothetical protein